MPHDFDRVVDAVRDGRNGVLLIIGALPPVGPPLHPQIVIPPLSRRRADLPRIIAEFAADAAIKVGRRAQPLREDDQRLVAGLPDLTLGKIEVMTRRLAALRAAPGDHSVAASLAGIDPATFDNWLDNLNARVPMLDDTLE